LENSKGLAGVVTDLKTKVDSLDENKIETISARLQKLSDQYDQLKAKAVDTTGVTPQQEKKVNQLNSTPSLRHSIANIIMSAFRLKSYSKSPRLFNWQ